MRIVAPSCSAAQSSVRGNTLTRKGSAQGFSLIEVLGVVAIVSILAAVAVPQFFIYRSRAVDTKLKSDLKSAALAQEGYFALNHAYTSNVARLASYGFIPSSGVTITATKPTSNSYTFSAAAPGGTQPSFTLDSVTGSIN